ncbi:restriction endonuclease subunit S [Methanosarcina sp.]|uniref:restriction endonuclease subunit S n=1 Tax=Methanosarcina sp. TaxID=2213 RepID=UPI002AB95294|nr:restriction endonuclease subunit S [Methanosarcina sp.]MDY9925719.1 restriction endonuclease subunit S [Methanosarcina sp.]
MLKYFKVNTKNGAIVKEKVGWIKGVLSDFGEVVSGGTPKTKVAEYWGEDISWITPADLSGYSEKYIHKGRKSITHLGLKNSSAKLMPKGSVLFSSRAPIGYVAVAGNELCTNQGFKSLVPKEDVNSDFLFYYFKSIKQLAEKKASGTTFKEISGKVFADLPLCLPPLPEQRAIVSKIELLFSELDNGIANLKLAQEQLKVYRQAVLKKAFEGELTKKWREQQMDLPDAGDLLEQIQREREEAAKATGKTVKPVKPLTEAKMAELPEKWVWTRVEELGEVTGGLTKNSKRNKMSTTLPYLRVANVYSNELRLDELKYIGIESQEIPRVLLKEGDLLVVEGNGSVDQIGRVAIWNGKISPCVHQNHIIKVRFQIVEIGKFVLFWLLSFEGRNQITKIASSTSGLYTLNISKIASLSIPLAPLPEQQAIIQEIETRLSVCDKIEQDIKENLEKAEALRQSILKKAFEGKLLNERELAEVRKAEDWEPAEVLLERIRK